MGRLVLQRHHILGVQGGKVTGVRRQTIRQPLVCTARKQGTQRTSSSRCLIRSVIVLFTCRLVTLREVIRLKRHPVFTYLSCDTIWLGYRNRYIVLNRDTQTATQVQAGRIAITICHHHLDKLAKVANDQSAGITGTWGMIQLVI